MYSQPELGVTGSSLRISPEIDVPVTKRIKRIIDTAAFRRLSRISQLGLVACVYPGATHSRFEHSLGVYRNAILFVNHLSHDETFCELVDDKSVSAFLLAALLHDIGHWPYCHAIEDMKLIDVARHEHLAWRLISEGEVADAIQEDWGVSTEAVLALLDPDNDPPKSSSQRVLSSLLSGPIDIDKLDYLDRDSLHAGVPYGRNFDRNRLIRSLCIHPETQTVALTEKGKTAAEMLVFARYIMFSEVYWHHAVRSATAMLQRAVFELTRSDWFEHKPERWLEMTETQMMDDLLSLSRNQPWAPCVEGLFGSKRVLYKRIAQFDCLSQPELHARLARRPFESNVAVARQVATKIGEQLRRQVLSTEILVDAPPAKLEVQFQIDVLTSDRRFRPLSQLSPMVESLATRQFDDIVKRVRIFAHPDLAQAIKESKLNVVDLM
jgi:uncharacterized protein